MSLQLILCVGLISTLLAVPLALARNASKSWIAIPVGIASWAMRGLPPIVVLFFVYFVAPQIGITIDPFPAAVIGMSAYMAFYLAESVRGGLLAVDAGQHLAARALALGPARSFVRIVFPQALPAIVPSYISYTTEIVKDSALAGTIAVPELMSNAAQLITSLGKPFQILLMVGVVYVGLDGLLLGLQARAEARWRRRRVLR